MVRKYYLLFLFCSLILKAYHSYGQDTVISQRLPAVEVVGVKALPHPAVIYSSFKRSLNLLMDKYHHTSGIKVKSLEKAPNEICAATFVNKDSGMQHVIKIEGKIMPFSSDSLRMYIAVIQSDSIIKVVEILPEQIKKKAYTLFPENLYIAPGNFYVGYIYKFARPCDVFYLTNKNFPNHIFSLQQDAPETFSIAGDAPDIYQMFYRTPQLRIVAQ